jgi:hypothetical protein
MVQTTRREAVPRTSIRATTNSLVRGRKTSRRFRMPGMQLKVQIRRITMAHLWMQKMPSSRTISQPDSPE